MGIRANIFKTPMFKEALCQECKGYGVVWNPVWRAWHDQHKAAGYPTTDEYFAMHPMPEDSEELTCGGCGGSGYVLTTGGWR